MENMSNVDDKGSQAVGLITQVHGPVVVIACDRLPPLRRALRASVDDEACLFEVHQHLDERHVYVTELEPELAHLFTAEPAGPLYRVERRAGRRPTEAASTGTTGRDNPPRRPE